MIRGQQKDATTVTPPLIKQVEELRDAARKYTDTLSKIGKYGDDAPAARRSHPDNQHRDDADDGNRGGQGGG